MAERRFALRDNETDKFIALDEASGGCAYPVESLFDAKTWRTMAEAERYNAIASWRDYDNPVYSVYAFSIQTRWIGDATTGEALESMR